VHVSVENENSARVRRMRFGWSLRLSDRSQLLVSGKSGGAAWPAFDKENFSNGILAG